jgi:hypothetical protein
MNIGKMRVIEFILILIFAIICISIYNLLVYIHNDVLTDTQRAIFILIELILMGVYYCYFDKRQLNLHIL